MSRRTPVASKKSKGSSQSGNFSSWCYLLTGIVAVALLSIVGYAIHEQKAIITHHGIASVQKVSPFMDVSIPTCQPSLFAKTSLPIRKIKGKGPVSPADSVYWGHGEFNRIEGFTSLTMDKHRNRRIVFANMTIELPIRSSDPSSGVVGSPRELIRANEILIRHPLHQFNHSGEELEDVMFFVKNSTFCTQKPIFLSMATVHDDLYWQLIENFVYTMVKFEVSDCSLVICVSDPKCMKLCDEAHFPCYNYVDHTEPVPSVMEQIATLKLSHVPKALARGVDVFMLDLDVGFLEDPNYMVKAFNQNSIVDMLVQEDLSFVMNRTVAGWKQWWTEPLPNIGLLLCRGNEKTARVFNIAWESYSRITDPNKKRMPGKDQNHVLEAIRQGRWSFGLKFAYFDNYTAPLLDKLIKNHGTAMELGGDFTGQYLHKVKSIAMHTTCYEKSTKVMGLKATNSFWNPRYYDPLRPTLTKQILFLDEKQLLDEVRSLVWLAISTSRSLIIPNILGDSSITSVAPYKGQVLWPGFRVAFLKKREEDGKNILNVEILEPAYYWRVERDYDPAPEPYVLHFDPDKDTLKEIKSALIKLTNQPRVILYPLSRLSNSKKASEGEVAKMKLKIAAAAAEVLLWANDSVGVFARPYSEMLVGYGRVPSVKQIRQDPLAAEVLPSMRNCARIFNPSKGNRTCFQICK